MRAWMVGDGAMYMYSIWISIMKINKVWIWMGDVSYMENIC